MGRAHSGGTSANPPWAGAHRAAVGLMVSRRTGTTRLRGASRAPTPIANALAAGEVWSTPTYADTPTQFTVVSAFAACVFVNAFLLFLLQPMFGKMALPHLGGSAAVWTTCMLFFETALLAGYLYAHALASQFP